MGSESNPFEAARPLHPEVSGGVWFAVLAGTLVFAFSCVIMVAFLFGIAVAVVGRTEPGPVDLAQFFSGRRGAILSTGLLGVLPVAGLLGFVTSARVLRVRKNLREADSRRRELREQLEQLRQAHASLKDGDQAGDQK